MRNSHRPFNLAPPKWPIPHPSPLRGPLHLQVKRAFCFTSGPAASRCASYIKPEPVLSVQSVGALQHMLSCRRHQAAMLFCIPLSYTPSKPDNDSEWLSLVSVNRFLSQHSATQIFHPSLDPPKRAHFCTELHEAKRIFHSDYSDAGPLPGEGNNSLKARGGLCLCQHRLLDRLAIVHRVWMPCFFSPRMSAIITNYLQKHH